MNKAEIPREAQGKKSQISAQAFHSQDPMLAMGEDGPQEPGSQVRSATQ